MTAQPPLDWPAVEETIRSLLAVAKSFLPSDTLHGVEHYLDHAEYEMAFEGLLLDLMQAVPNRGALEVDWSSFVRLGRELGLDRESTFDPDFWEKFSKYAIT